MKKRIKITKMKKRNKNYKNEKRIKITKKKKMKKNNQP